MARDDDPEKRIAELERMQNRASAGWTAERPPAYPPAPHPGWQQTPDWPQQPQAGQPPLGQSRYGSVPDYSGGLPAKYRPPHSARSRSRGNYRIVVAIIAAILLASMGVGAGGYLALSRRHAYAIGIPATAELFECPPKPSKSNKTCFGSWTVDGAKQVGPVEGTDAAADNTGTTVDVRVHNGVAYTAGVVASAERWTAIIAVYAVTLAVGGLLFPFWYIRRRRRRN